MAIEQDAPYIFAYWDLERGCNIYGSRSSSDELWAHVQSLPSAFTTYSDFPWSYFAFCDTTDEQEFKTKWVIHDDEESPPCRVLYRMPDPVDFKWDQETRSFIKVVSASTSSFEDELLELLSAEITKELDANILAKMLELAKK